MNSPLYQTLRVIWLQFTAAYFDLRAVAGGPANLLGMALCMAMLALLPLLPSIGEPWPSTLSIEDAAAAAARLRSILAFGAGVFVYALVSMRRLMGSAGAYAVWWQLSVFPAQSLRAAQAALVLLVALIGTLLALAPLALIMLAPLGGAWLAFAALAVLLGAAALLGLLLMPLLDWLVGEGGHMLSATRMGVWREAAVGCAVPLAVLLLLWAAAASTAASSPDEAAAVASAPIELQAVARWVTVLAQHPRASMGFGLLAVLCAVGLTMRRAAKCKA